MQDIQPSRPETSQTWDLGPMSLSRPDWCLREVIADHCKQIGTDCNSYTELMFHRKFIPFEIESLVRGIHDFSAPIITLLHSRASNEGLQRFHNHCET